MVACDSTPFAGHLQPLLACATARFGPVTACRRSFGRPVVAPAPKGAALSNHLDDERLALLLHCLLEGNSCRGTGRLAEVDLNTVYRWLDRAAQACVAIHDELIQGLSLESLQADEM